MKTIKVGSEEVTLDEEALNFNPENINDFLAKFPALHRYYQGKHNDASYIAKSLNDKYIELYNTKFREYKGSGKGLSDKTAEACAKSDDEVVKSLEKVRCADYVKDEIAGFLRSMDYSHSNCKELCYNLRKELSSIFPQSISEMEVKLKDIYNNK